MKIKLPAMVGIKAHASLRKKIDAAVSSSSFPIDFDCADTAFTTTGFCQFIIRAKNAVQTAGGSIRLLNVGPELFDGIKAIHLHEVVEVQPKATKPRK